MTNYERLANMSIRELANEICAFMPDRCSNCPGFELCDPDDGAANGMIKWLNEESKDDSKW